MNYFKKMIVIVGASVLLVSQGFASNYDVMTNFKHVEQALKDHYASDNFDASSSYLAARNPVNNFHIFGFE